jgi:translation initiation factor IF-1
VSPESGDAQRDLRTARDAETASRARVGTVKELLPNATCRLVLEDQREVLAHAAGAAKVNFVRLRPGDRVRVEVSPHDRGRGRIVELLRD